MGIINNILDFDTQLYADCVQWCPIEGYEHLLMCATYQLTEEVKKGSIFLFSFPASANTLSVLQEIKGLPGILDAKWKPQLMTNGKAALATVDSEGYLTVYSLNDSATELAKLTSITLFPDISPSPLALYVDWSPFETNQLTVSSSNGYLTLVEFNGTDFAVQQQWNGHSFEAWVAMFDRNNPNILYSGGDDSVMKCYDYRQDPAQTVWKSSAHTAGVTSFMTSIKRPNQFSSGSYDEYLKLWDSRMPKPTTPLSELCLGGGVWRVSERDYTDEIQAVIAACMFAGFKLLHWNQSSISVIDSYRSDDECLAYGVDWSSTNTFAACSYYDHKLMLCQSE
ncbi:hypothetical protein B566_EDAN003117 [Ephemera danica]|nr:hypothetical protein B566_EDAN003117 [Ephemera danica]